MNRQIDDINELKSFFFENPSIVLYGAGNVCKKILRYNKLANICLKIDSIFVSGSKNNPKMMEDIPIRVYKGELIDKPIVVAVGGLFRDEILCELKDNGNVYYFTNEFEIELDTAIRNLYFHETVERLKCHAVNDGEEDIRFFSPPYWDAYSPFSAVPCLVAQLRRSGYTVGQVDLGILCIHELLQKRWKEVAHRVLSVSYYEEFVKNYTRNTYSNYKDFADDMWFLQGNSFDVERVKNEYSNMNPVQKRVVDSFYGELCNIDSSGFDFDRCKNLHDEVERYKNSDFLTYISSERITKYFDSLPNVIGISMTSAAQFLPGCLLAMVIKEIKPKSVIIAGGSCADLFVQWGYKNKNDIKEYFDYIIIGEGETAITEIMAFLTGKRSTDEGIPNLVYFNSKGDIHVCEQIIENVETLPCADYDGLDLSLYLASERILPYQTSRGCHYGYCGFCNHDEKYRHNYRSKDMKIVVDELLFLSQKYNVHCFQFVDEAIRFDRFEEMVNEMNSRADFHDIEWFYYSRVDRRYNKELLEKAKKNGCRMVMFGIETLNQRLLNLIKKGILAENSRYCMKLFHEMGIKVFAWLMCNLPSETVDEAKQDLRDIQSLHEYISAISVGMFFLSKNTDMYAEPEKYNITQINENDEWRFESKYEGKTIDKDAMFSFFHSEYAKYQRELFGGGNRYTLFFEE